MEEFALRSEFVKKLEFSCPFRKATDKTEKSHLIWIFFESALHILNIKGKICLQYPATFCLLNSNVDNPMPDLDINPSIVY